MIEINEKKYNVIDGEKIYLIDNNLIERAEDHQYYLNFKPKKEDNIIHYVIKDYVFNGPVNIYISGNAILEFKQCEFHDQIYSILSDTLVFNNCNYSFDGMSLNDDLDEEFYFLRGTTKNLKFMNDNFVNKIDDFYHKVYSFSIDMVTSNLEIINSIIDYNRLKIEANNIKIDNSTVISKAELHNRDDKIKADKVIINDSKVLTDSLNIDTNELLINNSEIEARNQFNLNTQFINDSSNIKSSIIIINNKLLIEQSNEYVELKNARIRLIEELNKIKKQTDEIVIEKVKKYEKKLNNKGIASIIK